jgi:hypothetical protein
MIFAIGQVYTENKIGPNTEPYGTPHITGMIEEEFGSILAEKALFVR